MHFIIAAETTIADWMPLIIQLIVTSGAIFGSAGFWQWKSAREQAKREEISKESGLEKKVEDLAKTVSTFDTKLDTVSKDMQRISEDIALLEAATDAANEYITNRTNQDQEVMDAQRAIISSLTGLLRDRLLDAYNRCMEKGYYTKAERETYGELFKCYESAPFNGNGVMHQIRPIMQALPWTEEDAKKAKRNKSKEE